MSSPGLNLRAPRFLALGSLVALALAAHPASAPPADGTGDRLARQLQWSAERRVELEAEQTSMRQVIAELEREALAGDARMVAAIEPILRERRVELARIETELARLVAVVLPRLRAQESRSDGDEATAARLEAEAAVEEAVYWIADLDRQLGDVGYQIGLWEAADASVPALRLDRAELGLHREWLERKRRLDLQRLELALARLKGGRETGGATLEGQEELAGAIEHGRRELEAWWIESPTLSPPPTAGSRVPPDPRSLTLSPQQIESRLSVLAERCRAAAAPQLEGCPDCRLSLDSYLQSAAERIRECLAARERRVGCFDAAWLAAARCALPPRGFYGEALVLGPGFEAALTVAKSCPLFTQQSREATGQAFYLHDPHGLLILTLEIPRPLWLAFETGDGCAQWLLGSAEPDPRLSLIEGRNLGNRCTDVVYAAQPFGRLERTRWTALSGSASLRRGETEQAGLERAGRSPRTPIDLRLEKVILRNDAGEVLILDDLAFSTGTQVPRS